MRNNSFLSIPKNLPTDLQRFLQELLIKIDEAYGNRGDNKFVKEKELTSTTLPYLSSVFVRLDGQNKIKSPLKYEDNVSFLGKNEIPNKDYIDSNFINIKGDRAIISPLKYVVHPNFIAPTQLIDKQYVDEGFKANKVIVVTSDYTTQDENIILVDDTEGNVTITLGEGYNKQHLTIMKISNTYNKTLVNDKTLVYVNSKVTYFYYNNQWIEC